MYVKLSSESVINTWSTLVLFVYALTKTILCNTDMKFGVPLLCTKTSEYIQIHTYTLAKRCLYPYSSACTSMEA